MTTILLFLQATAAFACPDLDGAYLCRQNDFRTETEYIFDQVNVGGVWKFSMTAIPEGRPVASRFRFYADGVEREIIDEITGTKLLATASCDATSLKVIGKASLDKPQPINFSETLSLTPEGDLSNVSLDIKGNPFQEICPRLE